MSLFQVLRLGDTDLIVMNTLKLDLKMHFNVKYREHVEKTLL